MPRVEVTLPPKYSRLFRYRGHQLKSGYFLQANGHTRGELGVVGSCSVGSVGGEELVQMLAFSGGSSLSWS